MQNEYSSACATPEADATSSKSTDAPGAATGTLATTEAIVDLSPVIAEIQVLFEALALHDDRFGMNGYRSCRLSDRSPDGHAVYDGWHHPAMQTFFASKGYRDRHDLMPQDLHAIAWNLKKKLAEFEEGSSED